MRAWRHGPHALLSTPRSHATGTGDGSKRLLVSLHAFLQHMHKLWKQQGSHVDYHAWCSRELALAGARTAALMGEWSARQQGPAAPLAAMLSTAQRMGNVQASTQLAQGMGDALSVHGCSGKSLVDGCVLQGFGSWRCEAARPGELAVPIRREGFARGLRAPPLKKALGLAVLDIPSLALEPPGEPGHSLCQTALPARLAAAGATHVISIGEVAEVFRAGCMGAGLTLCVCDDERVLEWAALPRVTEDSWADPTPITAISEWSTSRTAADAPLMAHFTCKDAEHMAPQLRLWSPGPEHWPGTRGLLSRLEAVGRAALIGGTCPGRAELTLLARPPATVLEACIVAGSEACARSAWPSRGSPPAAAAAGDGGGSGGPECDTSCVQEVAARWTAVATLACTLARVHCIVRVPAIKRRPGGTRRSQSPPPWPATATAQ